MSKCREEMERLAQTVFESWNPSPKDITRHMADVERLQEISEADAKAEGVGPHPAHHFCRPERRLTQAFATLWDSINVERAPWSSNPWVWVVSFRRIHG